VILLYPFLTTRHIRKRVIGKDTRRAGYAMFNYVGLEDPDTARTTLLNR
jgi:hypothetical protein